MPPPAPTQTTNGGRPAGPAERPSRSDSGRGQKKGAPAVIPDRLQVPLVLESDAPCQVKLNSLASPLSPDPANPDVAGGLTAYPIEIRYAWLEP